MTSCKLLNVLLGIRILLVMKMKSKAIVDIFIKYWNLWYNESIKTDHRKRKGKEGKETKDRKKVVFQKFVFYENINNYSIYDFIFYDT